MPLAFDPHRGSTFRRPQFEDLSFVIHIRHSQSSFSAIILCRHYELDSELLLSDKTFYILVYHGLTANYSDLQNKGLIF